jgi:fatty acid desaturase
MLSIYGAWGAATFFHEALPIWALLPIGAILIAWHGSFQHEAVHDNFSKRRWLNDLIAYPPLSLWLPYPIYRRSHRAHHNFKILTDPWRDPESFYVDQERWTALPKSLRALLIWHNTLLGRILIGPLMAIGQFLHAEARALIKGDRTYLPAWLIHAPAVAAVLIWLTLIADMPIWLYIACFVLPGLSLTLVRSFAEHKAANTPLERTAIVEAGWFFSLLFLNNNLHFAHHRRPGLPWQALPRYYRRHRETLLRENGGLRYAGGYRELARRFLTRPVDQPEHPFC